MAISDNLKDVTMDVERLEREMVRYKEGYRELTKKYEEACSDYYNMRAERDELQEQYDNLEDDHIRLQKRFHDSQQSTLVQENDGWYLWAGDTLPSDLAPKQLVDVLLASGFKGEAIRADSLRWSYEKALSDVEHYRPAYQDGLPVVDGQDLPDWAKYVATDFDGTFCFEKYPIDYTASETWLTDGEYDEISNDYQIPGEWENSLAVVRK